MSKPDLSTKARLLYYSDLVNDCSVIEKKRTDLDYLAAEGSYPVKYARVPEDTAQFVTLY